MGYMETRTEENTMETEMFTVTVVNREGDVMMVVDLSPAQLNNMNLNLSLTTHGWTIPFFDFVDGLKDFYENDY
jgi:hypothetical protein